MLSVMGVGQGKLEPPSLFFHICYVSKVAVSLKRLWFICFRSFCLYEVHTLIVGSELWLRTFM